AWLDDLLTDPCRSGHIAPLPVESTHPLYILYTSGTTGKPKGIVHGTGGYLVYNYSAYRWVFDLKDESVYWCTADVGWVTGHSAIVYGPLAHGATIVLYEGVPDYPGPDRWWDIVEKYGVTVFYTSPTAVRMLMKYGDDWPRKHDLSSLDLLGSVGEPINPEAWRWYYEHIGQGRCPIVDTWWQTETGGIMISPTPGIERLPLKPGSATFPLPGIEAVVVNEQGQPTAAGERGLLAIKRPWPGMLLGIHGAPERYKEAYWSRFPGLYYSGDYAIKDNDGYFWILGRADEVLKIAGHRLGTGQGRPGKGRGHHPLCHPQRWSHGLRRTQEGSGQPYEAKDRPHSYTGSRLLRGQAAQDQERQDHAPSAQGGGHQHSPGRLEHPGGRVGSGGDNQERPVNLNKVQEVHPCLAMPPIGLLLSLPRKCHPEAIA
ncbi:MAG: acetyl-coenzyme synthetase, partial [Dehalococcoidia bacterium]|nr:acetyl-coenzyme synthetase [Dehalococcoidia bacterium]